MKLIHTCAAAMTAAMLTAGLATVPAGAAATVVDPASLSLGKAPTVAFYDKDAQTIRDGDLTVPVTVPGLVIDVRAVRGGYAVVTSSVQHWRIWLVGRDGEASLLTARLIGSGADLDVVSTDGRRIAYLAQVPGERYGLLRVRSVVDGTLVATHRLSWRTRLLAYQDGRVWFTQPNGFGGWFDVAHRRTERFGHVRRPLLAADPRVGAVVRAGDRTKDGSCARVLPIRVRATWSAWSLCHEDGVAAWSPDGRYLLAYDEDPMDHTRVGRLVVRNARTGAGVRAVTGNFIHRPYVVWESRSAFLVGAAEPAPAEGGAALVRCRVGGGCIRASGFGGPDPWDAPFLPATQHH